MTYGSCAASVARLDLTDLDPRRWGTTAVDTGSVCQHPIEQGGTHQVWLSMPVAIDVLPLLVHACSTTCLAALPAGGENHISSFHMGGRVEQPAADWD